MTPAVNGAIERFLDATGYARMARVADLIVIAVLVVLLVEYEVVRAYRGGRGPSMRPLLIGVVPLIPVFFLIAVVRAAGLR